MTQRNPILVLLLCCTPYALYWYYVTANELKAKQGLDMPPIWMILIMPLYAYMYYTKAEKVAGVSWILGVLFGPIAAYLAQTKYNALAGGAAQRAA